MTIKEKGYTHWDGELKKKRFPWFPITRYGIKLTFNKKFFKFFFATMLIPAIFFLVGIYISERIEDFNFMVQGSTQFLEVNPAYFNAYMTNGFLLFWINLIMVFCGAGLIADDLRHNALQLYFSRPLKKMEYLLGKAAVIVFFLFIVTLIPGLVFIIMKLLFAGNFKFLSSYPWLPFSVIGYSILITGFFAFYTLLLSSVSKNRRYVAVLIFGLYLFSDILFAIFNGIFRSQYFSLLSLRANLQQAGAFIFHQKMPYDIPWFYPFLVLFGVCILSGFVLRNKVRGVDIVK